MTLQDYIAARRGMRARMTPGQWITGDSTPETKYLDYGSVYAKVGPDLRVILACNSALSICEHDAEGIATIVNEYERLLAALEALIVEILERRGSVDGTATIEQVEATNEALAALLACAKEAGDA